MVALKADSFNRYLIECHQLQCFRLLGGTTFNFANSLERIPPQKKLPFSHLPTVYLFLNFYSPHLVL